MNNLIRHYFDCQCTSFCHTFRMTIDPINGDIWLEIHLAKLPWYKRILVALKYVFNIKVHDSYFYEEIMIRHDDYDKIKSLLDMSTFIRSELPEYSKYKDYENTLPLEMNILEAHCLERIINEARFKKYKEHKSSEVHTLYPKVLDLYERLRKGNL